MNTLNRHIVSRLTNSIKKSAPHYLSFPRTRESRLSCLSWIPGRCATNFRHTSIAPIWLIVFLLFVLAVPCLAESSPSDSQSAIPAATKQKLAKVQIPFIANQGQSDKDVKFYARTFAGTVSVTETGQLVYSFPKLEDKKRVAGVTLKEELVGGKVTEVKGESQAKTKLNYFKGNDRSKWLSNIPSYDIVSLGEIYEGIDVKLKAYGNNVEKLFHVKPGATPQTIKIKLSGGKGIRVRVNEGGELEVETEQGTVKFSKPVAFQEDETKKEFVEVAYAVRGNEYGFEVRNYDHTRELVIDPILAATFLGGSDDDIILALALDAAGNAYVAGGTDSSDFPGVGTGSADSNFSHLFPSARSGEAFVAKVNSDLSAILAATFLGGSQGERAEALALDSTGNVYVAGVTDSSDFPGVGPGSADNTFNGGNDGFVAKLNPDLSAIVAATFLGGSSQTDLSTVAVDNAGNVYVAGDTLSTDFPGVGPGSADNIFDNTLPFGGGVEGFVAKVNSDLSTILTATFLGGSRSDMPRVLAIDGTGNIYVAGDTTSSDFPGVGPESADNILVGEGNTFHEGFVAKLNSDLSSILAATFLGGEGSDESVQALTVDSAGNVYAAGFTDSADFPGIGPNSADRVIAAHGREGFVAKLNADLSSILAATFLGGSSGGESAALALDSRGNVYVAGGTTSADFPGIGPGSAISTFAGSAGFVAKLNADLSTVLVSTFLKEGIHGTQTAFAVALGSTGNVYVAGGMTEGLIPGIGPGSADSTIAGFGEGFVAKLDANLSSGQEIVNNKVNFVVQSTSLNPTPVPGGPAGVFTITARLTNTSTENILEPINAIVKTLTNGNKLLSATEGNGGAGSKQAIDAGADETLIPKESAIVQFRIGLANRNRFSFFVDVSGIVNGDD
jgi:Beta-propeller repeat